MQSALLEKLISWQKKGNRLDLYEVKCSYRIVKARKQLERIKNILNLKNAGSYFYCGNSKDLVSV